MPFALAEPQIPEDAESHLRTMTRERFMDFTIGGRAIPEPAIQERKVTRYYYGGKGYATRLAAYKAYARSVMLDAIRELAGPYDKEDKNNLFHQMMLKIWGYINDDDREYGPTQRFAGWRYGEDIRKLAKELLERDAQNRAGKQP